MDIEVNNSAVQPGLWETPYVIANMFASIAAAEFPFAVSGQRFCLKAVNEEKGRISLFHIDSDGDLNNLLPAPYDIRTTVHEYGGVCHCIIGTKFVFNDRNLGVIFAVDLNDPEDIQQITCGRFADNPTQFADLSMHPDGIHVVAVMESAQPNGVDNINSVVVFSLRSNEKEVLKGRDTVREIATGSDFYSCPRFSPTGRELLWLEWDHPYMPWDYTRLMMARLDPLFVPLVVVAIYDQPQHSICQVDYLDDGRFVFALDAAVATRAIVSKDVNLNYWNLYLGEFNFSSDEQARILRITKDAVEYGEAHWVFGQRRWLQRPGGGLIAIASGLDGDVLLNIDLANKQKRVIYGPSARIEHLSYDRKADKILAMIHHADKASQMCQITLQGGSQDMLSNNATKKNQPAIAPRLIRYAGEDGKTVFAYFYDPYNGKAKTNLPPLLVLVHGGPTSRTNAAYHGLKQYFVSLGFAILDVNHRGSTGYGRAYRDELYGQWGVIDAADIACGVRYLQEQGVINKDLVFIRGGSAGGYAVLRVLTEYPDLFAGGACYYGIGNLVTLCEHTHKFESRYVDRLVDEPFDMQRAQSPRSAYQLRSPINAINNIRAPLILFQGGMDKVVPPEVSQEMVAGLKANNIDHEYYEYPEEGHGFRVPANRIDSLQAEVAFFQRIIVQQTAADEALA